jgi:predicted secreted protein
MQTPSLMALALAGLLLNVTPTRAEIPPALGVVGLSAQAGAEVPRDLMTLTLSTTREGPDAGTVQRQLRQALDAALAEARKAVRPGELDVQTGNFSLSPRYASVTTKGSSNGLSGGIDGWQGSAELLISGRDMPAIAALTGRITTMSIARVGYGLSREVREKVEAEVAAQAVGRFRAKAADYARLLGFGGYAVREVTVQSEEPGTFVPAMRARALAASADEALPVEAGKGSMTVSVSGTVQLTK